MKKKIIAIISVLVLCLSISVPVFAVGNDGFADEYYRVNDMAGILSEEEEAALLERLDEISRRQSMDIAVVTVENLNGYSSAMEYADDIYDFCGYGYGENKDGLLLLISMEERDWYISTCGYGITVFTDAGIDYIGEKMKPDLSEGNYAKAFETYADLCDEFITQAKDDTPYDTSNFPREPLSMIWIPISIVIGVVLALIIVGVMKGKLKTVRSQAAANSYLKKDSLNIETSQDLFLYSTVSRTKIEREESSDGGSSTHTSSSGSTHGGGGGKF